MKKIEFDANLEHSILDQYLLPKREKYPKDWTESQKRTARRRKKKAIDEMPKQLLKVEYTKNGGRKVTFLGAEKQPKS